MRHCHAEWLFWLTGRGRIWNVFRCWYCWFCYQDLRGIGQHVDQKAPKSRLLWGWNGNPWGVYNCGFFEVWLFLQWSVVSVHKNIFLLNCWPIRKKDFDTLNIFYSLIRWKKLTFKLDYSLTNKLGFNALLMGSQFPRRR